MGNWGEKKTLIRGYIYTVLASEAKKTSLLQPLYTARNSKSNQTLLDKIRNGLYTGIILGIILCI